MQQSTIVVYSTFVEINENNTSTKIEQVSGNYNNIAILFTQLIFI